MDHAEARVTDLLLYGWHADRDGTCLRATDVSVEVRPLALVVPPGVEIEQFDATRVRSLVIVAATLPHGVSRARELGLRASETRIATREYQVRGQYQPCYLWYEDPMGMNGTADMRYNLDVLAHGLDLTGNRPALDLVVAHIVGLRKAVGRNGEGSR